MAPQNQQDGQRAIPRRHGPQAVGEHRRTPGRKHVVIHAAHRGEATALLHQSVPNLIREYVLGDDNLADIFSRPPFV